jgi:16S rRNA (guanine527-N7)-methyltransferase
MEKTPSKLELIYQYFGDFTPEQTLQLASLYDLYLDWNSKINVISRKDIDALYEKHVLHSLAIAAMVDFPDGSTVIDIGTGGGFPGIPLAIFFPKVQFHLVDSINKKLTVVKEIAQAAGIKNITTQHTRAEDIKDRKFDYAVSRAVAPLGELWRWAKPLLKKNNHPEYPTGLICLKGGDLHQEISESGCKPKLVPLSKIYKEPFFQEKYLLYVAKT